MITPEVGQHYWLGLDAIRVIEAKKKRYWRIVAVAVAPGSDEADGAPFTIPQSEWAAKAERVGP